MLRMEIKGCIYARSGKVHYQFFNHFVMTGLQNGGCIFCKKRDLGQLPLVRSIQLHRFMSSQWGDLVKIHLVAQMPTTDVAQWTYAVSNLGFIYIYGRCNIGTLIFLWGQRLHIKVIGHLRLSCKIGWKYESGLIWKAEVWLKPNLVYRYNMGPLVCSCGQRSYMKIRGYIWRSKVIRGQVVTLT